MVPPQTQTFSISGGWFQITPFTADRGYVNTLIFPATTCRFKHYVESTTAAAGDMR